jgi:hypothetical protein
VKYVICHGALLSPAQKFDRGSTKIGFYVNALGETLSQSAAVPILREQQTPTKYVESPNCPELQLTPLAQRDWGAFTQALGPYAASPDIYLLPVATRLSALVAELGQDELRLITCTAVQGASRQARIEEVLPGIMVETPVPRMAERPENLIVDHNANQLLLKRQKSAEVAAAYLGQLGDQSAALWSKSNVTHAVMTEWAISRLPAITQDVGTWADPIWYVMHLDGGVATLHNAGQWSRFPNFGEDARARLRMINGYLTTWPDCVPQLAQIHSAEAKFESLHQYLADPAVDNAVRSNARRFVDKLLPAQQRAAAIRADNLDTWHAYLLALQGLDADDLAGLRRIVDVDRNASWMVDCAVTWDDFPRIWSVVQTRYGGTIAPLLIDRSQHNPTLRSRIDVHEHPTRSTQIYADSMDFTPASSLTAGPSQVQPKMPLIFCPDCGYKVAHQPTDLATARKKHEGVRVCAGCRTVIGNYEDPAVFACTQCQSIAMAHTTCVAASEH